MELLLLLIPAFFALSVWLLPQGAVRIFGLIGGLATLAITACLACCYQPDSGIHYILKGEWIAAFGMTKNMGYDGISLVMLFITNGLIPIILLANYSRELASDRRFTSMLFFMQVGLIGVFLSFDGILFYLFWELTLLPIYLIAYWYGDSDRKAALLKFFIYTFFGSLFMLASLIGLKSMATSFAWEDLAAVELTAKMAFWLMGGFFLAFAIKVPLFPFHTWQPDTYTKAPMAGTMLLSGIMLKMALYGMIRWMIPLFPEALDCVTEPIIILGVIGVVYGAILAIKQNDMKRLFAYASISHVGLIAAGIMTFDKDTLSGSMIQMINHGLVAVGLFLAADIIERRVGTRQLDQLGGFAKQAPSFGFWFAALAFASVSVPFTSGFIGEFLLLKGLYSYHWLIGVIAGTTLILGAVYTFRAYQLSMYGPVTATAFEDLTWSEWLAFAIIMVVVVVLGICPQCVISFVEPSIASLIELVKNPTPLVP